MKNARAIDAVGILLLCVTLVVVWYVHAQTGMTNPSSVTVAHAANQLIGKWEFVDVARGNKAPTGVTLEFRSDGTFVKKYNGIVQHDFEGPMIPPETPTSSGSWSIVADPSRVMVDAGGGTLYNLPEAAGENGIFIEQNYGHEIQYSTVSFDESGNLSLTGIIGMGTTLTYKRLQ